MRIQRGYDSRAVLRIKLPDGFDWHPLEVETSNLIGQNLEIGIHGLLDLRHTSRWELAQDYGFIEQLS